MRIAFLNAAGQLGGAEVALLDILTSLRTVQPDWDLHLICGAEGPLVRRAKDIIGDRAIVAPIPPAVACLGDAGAGGPAGREVSRIGLLCRALKSTPAAWRYSARLRHELRAISPDIIQTNSFKMHILGAWANPGHLPLVWHVHDFIRARPVMAKALRFSASSCAMAIANSKAVAAEVSTLRDHLPVLTLYNAVDLERFSPHGARLDLDALCGMATPLDGAVRIGMLATMARWKGHEVFLRAIARLPENLPVRAYVIGGAIYDTAGSQTSVAELKTVAARLGIEAKVGFTGLVDDPAAAMWALDIVVHASTQPEPFGLVIAEAMACGRAVIAGDSAGAAELFTFGVDAIAHTPGDAEELSEKIEALATDPERRAALGARARETASKRFDRTRLAGELTPIYRTLVVSKSQKAEQPEPGTASLSTTSNR